MMASQRLRFVAAAAAIALIATIMATPANADNTAAGFSTRWTKEIVDGELVPPPSPNPYLANLPGADADYRSWDAYAQHRSAKAASERRRGPRSGAVNERPGNNNSPNKAQPVFLETANAEGRAGIDVRSGGIRDVDYFKFRLDEGDVFGATVFGGSSLALYAPGGDLLIGSSQDITFIHPAASPLPGGGNASLSYVVDQAGWYRLAVGTTG